MKEVNGLGVVFLNSRPLYVADGQVAYGRCITQIGGTLQIGEGGCHVFLAAGAISITDAQGIHGFGQTLRGSLAIPPYGGGHVLFDSASRFVAAAKIVLRLRIAGFGPGLQFI